MVICKGDIAVKSQKSAELNPSGADLATRIYSFILIIVKSPKGPHSN